MTDLNLVKLTWQERVKAVNLFHIGNLKLANNWTLENTAKELKRSTSSVGNDILVASFMKAYESKLTRFKTFHEALEWCRMKKRMMKMEV